MCGIAGYFALDLPAEEREPFLFRMVQALTHRGPDSEGHHRAGVRAEDEYSAARVGVRPLLRRAPCAEGAG